MIFKKQNFDIVLKPVAFQETFNAIMGLLSFFRNSISLKLGVRRKETAESRLCIRDLTAMKLTP